MDVIIKPSKLSGSVVIPPSKSLSHRAIIAAALAHGRSVISNVLYSKDIKATIGAMRACGATIEEHDDYLVIDGSDVKRHEYEIDANESGSTIRFMIPIALVCDEPVRFVGRNHLVNRPLDAFFSIFDAQGIKYSHGDTYLPLKVENGLKAGEFSLPGDVSSQFITGLLYALPLLDGDSKIIITTNLESKGYIDLTLDILSKFGIEIVNNDYKEFNVKGNQTFKPFDYTIEGDYSQSAFFLLADMLGADVHLKAMSKSSLQGDKKILEDVTSFGGELAFTEDDLFVRPVDLHSAIIDFSQSPDLGPALAVLASVVPGHSEFVNAYRLRIKECDRITCMKDNLLALGAYVTESRDGMQFEGVNEFTGGTVDSYNDHRIVMALAMASLKATGDIRITNASAITKSFPHFFEVFTKLGGVVIYE